VQTQPSGASILVVEDNADLCLNLALFLSDLDYPTVMAGNGREALVQLRSAPLPCLILLDLIMPVMNGWVFRAEQRQDPHLAAVPVIVMSGAVDNLAQESVALDAVAFLSKPIDINELVQLVARYC